MRRALTILKYAPAVLCGLLAVAWVVSLITRVPIIDGASPSLEIELGTIEFRQINTIKFQRIGDGPGRQVLFGDADDSRGIGLGRFEYSSIPGGMAISMGMISEWWQSRLFLPIPALLTLLLPLAIGPFNRFRFPLWSWFVFTALVAVELAYYLR